MAGRYWTADAEADTVPSVQGDSGMIRGDNVPFSLADFWVRIQ